MKERIMEHLEAAKGHLRTAAALADSDGDKDTGATAGEMAKGLDALLWDLSGAGDGEPMDDPPPVFWRADLNNLDDLLSGPCWTA